MNSYYDLLGVPPNATEMEIRSAYGRDVLRLQENASDSKVAQFRAALDGAFATLVDPAKRTAYDAELVAALQTNAVAASDDADEAFRYARRGGLWFAIGGLVTALTYAFSTGTYVIAWGPLIFGGFQLVRGVLRYLAVPSGARSRAISRCSAVLSRWASSARLLSALARDRPRRRRHLWRSGTR